MERSALEIAKRLPSDFVFGTATSSWQIEGDSKGRGNSMWDDFAKVPGNIIDGTTADPACDHIHNWRKDLDILSWLGVDAYRFSVSWPRIQPEGTGKVSESGLAFYDQLIDELLLRNIKPVLTLYHWDLPSPLQAKGGWVWEGISDIFADYAEIVSKKYADRVERWITLNEPWCSAFLGYASKVHAPGAGKPAQGFEAGYRLMLAHGRAINVLRSNNAKNLGIALNLTNIIGDDSEVAEAVEHLDGLQNRYWLDQLAGRGIPKDMVARTENFVDWSFVKQSELNEISQPIDWLGINYYTPTRIAKPSKADSGKIVGQSGEVNPGTPPASYIAREPRTEMGWEIDASSLTVTLKKTAERLPGVPLYLTENGAAFPDRIVNGKIIDNDRIDYYYNHINAALDARDQGVDLRGYYAWSLLDNIEWAEGWTKRFGLIYVDQYTQARTPKASAEFIKEILANRSKP